MEILSGLRVPDEGTVTLCGRPVVPGGQHRYDIGVQLQDAGLPQRLKVAEAVRSVASLYDDPGDVDGILRALGLDERLNQMVDQLSGGWQRRVDIALACIGRPRLLILDEPTSGLDPSGRAQLWEFLRDMRSRGVAVLASTHDLSEAESFADRLVVLDQGTILLDGTVDSVLGSAGGSWRVKVTGAGAGVLDALRSDGTTVLERTGIFTVIGDREEVKSLRDRLEDARAAGDIEFAEVAVGPVRLEDIFTYATTITQVPARGSVVTSGKEDQA
jgi:ABC-2 type transport system ATP-binding protein